MDPLADLAADRLGRTLALGTQRGELESLAPGQSPLVLLSLLGQRLRFSRTGSTRLPGTGRSLPVSQTPVTPEPVRAALLRMIIGREEFADLTTAAFAAVRQSGYRLHPFDLARLAPRLRGREEELGPVERAFLSFHQKQSDDESETRGDEPVTRDNWLTAPKAERLKFIQSIRLENPTEARALIEPAMTGAKAPRRAELVGVLRLRLTADDRPFLESLNGDRAQQVRELVTDLLARIPGTEAYEARFAEAAGMLAIVRSGLLKTNKILRVTPPKVPDDQLDSILEQRFRGISLRALLSKLEVSLNDVSSLAKGVDRVTAICLLWAASTDGDLETMAALVKSAELPQEQTLLLLEPELAQVPVQARRQLVERFLDLPALLADGKTADLMRLRRLLGGPVSASHTADLLGKGWKKVEKQIAGTDTPIPSTIFLAAVAALVPLAAATQFRQLLGSVDPEIADPSLRYADVLVALATRT